ncbi:MAG: hypothetical protein ACRD18_04040, partial [Terriglobia bacterium]
VRSGFRVPSKIVPATSEVCRWHAAHRSRPRAVIQAPPPSHAGYRTRWRYVMHARSEENHLSNS